MGFLWFYMNAPTAIGASCKITKSQWDYFTWMKSDYNKMPQLGHLYMSGIFVILHESHCSWSLTRCPNSCSFMWNHMNEQLLGHLYNNWVEFCDFTWMNSFWGILYNNWVGFLWFYMNELLLGHLYTNWVGFCDFTWMIKLLGHLYTNWEGFCDFTWMNSYWGIFILTEWDFVVLHEWTAIEAFLH